ncbi:hypothetical protein ACOI4E_06550 [Escherichia coli]
MWQGMQGSQQGNSGYLNEIASRTTRLDTDVKAYTGKPAMQLGSRITEPGAGALCLAGSGS